MEACWGRARRLRWWPEAILSTVKVGGNALLPTDSAGRVLELILLLEQVRPLVLPERRPETWWAN